MRMYASSYLSTAARNVGWSVRYEHRHLTCRRSRDDENGGSAVQGYVSETLTVADDGLMGGDELIRLCEDVVGSEEGRWMTAEDVLLSAPSGGDAGLAARETSDAERAGNGPRDTNDFVPPAFSRVEGAAPVSSERWEDDRAWVEDAKGSALPQSDPKRDEESARRPAAPAEEVAPTPRQRREEDDAPFRAAAVDAVVIASFADPELSYKAPMDGPAPQDEKAETSAGSNSIPPVQTVEGPEYAISHGRRLLETSPSLSDRSHSPMTILEVILPAIRGDLGKFAADRFASSEDGRTVAEYLLDKTRRTLPGGRDESDEATTIPALVGDTAVVYLPCRDESCTDMDVALFRSLAIHVPRSVKVVDVILPEVAAETIGGLAERYAARTVDFLADMYPRAAVDLVRAGRSSADAVGRMLVAEYVICGGGFGRMCVLPALARAAPSRIDGTRGRVTVLDRFESERDLLDGLPRDVLGHLRYAPTADEDGGLDPPTLQHFRGDWGSLDRCLRRPPPARSGQCRHVRGRLGSWIKDVETYAPQAQYDTPIPHQHGKTDRYWRERLSNGAALDPYRPPTTYRWAEKAFGPPDACKTNLVAMPAFCSALRSMDVRRVFFLGDSLTLQQFQSLWKLLRLPGDHPAIAEESPVHASYTVQCPPTLSVSGTDAGSYHEVTIEYLRSDQLVENDLPVDQRNLVKNCRNYCYPWTDAYLSDPRRTLLIANAGAHFREMDEFREAFDGFVNALDAASSGRGSRDLVLFRSTVPGHLKCGHANLAPYETYRDFRENWEGRKSWKMFERFNDYAYRVLDERGHRMEGADAEGNTARIELLDVFPMTVLRRDGHSGGEHKPPGERVDCLHYALPGPVDWWNHLMFSNLIDVAAELRSNGER